MNNLKDTIDRRTFMKASASLAALSLANPSVANQIASNGIERNQFDEWFIFNGMGGAFDINARIKDPKYSTEFVTERLEKAIRTSGLSCWRITCSPVYTAFPGEDVFQNAINSISWFHRWVRRHSDFITLVHSEDDVRKAKQAGKVGLTLCFQNSHVVGQDLDRVGIFKDLGVLTMQITYNGRNQLGGGANVSGRIPLSMFGHDAVGKMNEENVLIDLSHSGERTCLDAIKASKAPVTISHSGCRALVDIPRNKTDEEMRLLADKGGVFGLYFMPFLATNSNATSEHLIQHIEHAINVCGEDHVGLGTDSPITGMDDIEAVRKYTAAFTQKRIDSGAAAAGEKIGNLNFLPDLVGPNMYFDLAQKLSRRGHGDSRIEKILGANCMRLNKEVWGA